MYNCFAGAFFPSYQPRTDPRILDFPSDFRPLSSRAFVPPPAPPESVPDALSANEKLLSGIWSER